MIIKPITDAWLALDYTPRKELYKSLSAEGKNELYEAVTERHIARVPGAERRAIAHELEKEGVDTKPLNATWMAVSWYLHTGETTILLDTDPEMLQPVKDALTEAYEERTYYC